jgi:hypothetical protein
MKVQGFKIKISHKEAFKKKASKCNSLRFLENPNYDEDYIDMSFSIDVDEYNILCQECVDEGIHYYS